MRPAVEAGPFIMGTSIMVKVRHQGPAGFVHAGIEIDIEEKRHRALARNGIVPPLDGKQPPVKASGVRLAVTNSDLEPKRKKLTPPKYDSKK
jgi:hypothetical protein